MSLNVVKDATCTFCGCVCDDIELHAEGDRIVKARNACSLGDAWFKNHTAERLYPDALIDGKPATVDAAVEAAAGFLHEANMPLVYGLSNITCEAQREAVALTELIGGVIDSHTSLYFIVYWGGNPAECHPRHFTKYTLTQKGRFVPEGRKGRTMVLVDIRETPSARAADLFLQIRPGKDFEVLTTLRALVKKQRVDEEAAAGTGLTLDQLQDLVDRMKRARFGVLFFGMGVSMTRGKHMNSAAVLTLAAELNAFTKFVCMPMRGHGNVTGSDMVLRWSTGYPFGINLSRGYPRFNPGEFSTVDLLVRGDNDAALILGADPGATMPQPGIEHLARIPTIVLDPKVTHTSRLARVHITTAATGISAPGTVYRMDEVPLPLRPALKSPYPTDEEVIRRIRRAVAEKPAWAPAANAGMAIS